VIKFSHLEGEPINLFKSYFLKAVDAGQKNPDAMCISSINRKNNTPHSRFVNLKYVHSNELIFFSNYESNKAKHFISCNAVSCIFFWPSINIQIRIGGVIKKTSSLISDEHFALRSPDKNALAISSNQSSLVFSFDEVKKNFNNTLNNSNLTVRPNYWGGYSINPNYFEFWEGGSSRLNKRKQFELDSNNWVYSILEP